MAKNLRAKIPVSDTLLIRDVNAETTGRFVAESKELAKRSGAQGDAYRVEVAHNAREIAEKSVSWASLKSTESLAANRLSSNTFPSNLCFPVSHHNQSTRA